MPSNETERTKSGHKVLAKVLLGWAILVLLGLVTSFLMHSTSGSEVVGLAIRQKNATFTLSLTKVTTEADKEKGLGDTPKLDEHAGMLFWNDAERDQCFWMKDMRYSLDIIWVGADKRITAIEKQLSPKTYPKAFCHSGQYIIELNAGQADRLGLASGQKLSF